MYKCIWVILIFVGLFSHVLAEPTLTADPDYHAIIRGFFTELKQSKPGVTVSDLMPTNPDMADKQSVVISLSSKFESAVENLDGCIDYDIITNVLVTPKVASVIGFAKFNRQPVQVKFVFYKKSDK